METTDFSIVSITDEISWAINFIIVGGFARCNPSVGVRVEVRGAPLSGVLNKIVGYIANGVLHLG